MMTATCRRARQVDETKGIYQRVRASRHGPFGFSLIELLIAVFLLGLVMAAMFPVFVLALKTNSGDAARNIALNIAQDRIEKIRQLDFDDVTTLHLEDSNFYGGQFGKTYVDTRDGKSRTFDIFYAVKDVKPTATSTAILYKEVTVAVVWEGNPKPVKRVELKTVIYRQWSGPQTTSVSLTPAPTNPNLTTRTDLSQDARSRLENERWISDDTSSEKIDIFISASDTPQMSGVDEKGQPLLGWVSVTVTAAGGVPVVSDQKATVNATDATRYSFDWSLVRPPVSNATPDAMYTISVTAYSYDKSRGNTVLVRVRFETGAPPAPTGLTVVGSKTPDGHDQALLKWDVSPALDVMTYQIYRFDESHPGGVLVAGDLDQPTTWVTTNAFTDAKLTAHDSSYKVYAVDEAYQRSEVSSLVPIDWNAADPVPPAPTGLAATVAGSQVSLTWVQPTDVSNISGYQVFRDGEVVDTVSGLSWQIDQGWNTAATYQVQAISLHATTFSAFATIATGQTTQVDADGHIWLRVNIGTQPMYNIRVQSNVHVSANEVLTAQLYAGRGGSGTGLQYIAQWIGLARGTPSGWVLGKPGGWYSVMWQVTKKGVVVQDWQYQDFLVPVSAGSDQTLVFG
jgi:prepilin-type N-terminal cleavage/methylation domain-containing protein